MKPFEIYVSRTRGLQAIKSGWSWPAFFFGMFWALYKQLWLMAVIIFLVSFFLGAIGVPGFIGGIIVGIACGAIGNEQVAKKAKNDGYTYEGTIEAQNQAGALNEYMGRPRDGKF